MKRIFLFLLSLASLGANAQLLSDRATASMLTCGAGDDFYTSFGHSAIRITDSVNGLDLVYNYGTFDFDTPHFYWKFMRGQLNYCLSRTTFADFIDEYTYYGRPVSEQPLTFEAQQVQNLFLLLETNYLPQYRYYRYDFLRDNCATRVRDVVYSACGADTLLLRHSEPMSYRQLLATCLKDSLEWWRLGIDLLFGLPTDHRCTAPERMFLPAEMEAELAQCEVRSEKCEVSSEAAAPVSLLTSHFSLLTKPSRPLLVTHRTPLKASFPPVIVFSLLFAAIALLSLHTSHFPLPTSHFPLPTSHFPLPTSHFPLLTVIDRVLFILAGICGLFLCFMWFGTDHWCTQWNLNILWLSPLLILIAIRLERSPRWALWLQETMFLVALLWVLWCHLSIAIIPLIITLMLRVAILLLHAKH